MMMFPCSRSRRGRLYSPGELFPVDARSVVLSGFETLRRKKTRSGAGLRSSCVSLFRNDAQMLDLEVAVMGHAALFLGIFWHLELRLQALRSTLCRLVHHVD